MTYLATLFQKYGLSARDVAKAVGVSPQCAYNWTKNRSLPMAIYLPAVVKLLKRHEPSITIDKLMERENVTRKRKPNTSR